MREIIDIKKEYVFEALFCFILSGFLGWIFETAAVLLTDGKLTERGILFFSKIGGLIVVWGLPFILIYAVGGAVLICAFKPLKTHPILLFLVGAISMTTLELLVSYYDQYIVHQVLWDYSKEFLNFQGRICFRSSVVWGVLSIFTVDILSPFFYKIYNKLYKKNKMHLILLIVMIYIGICYLLRPIIFPKMV